MEGKDFQRSKSKCNSFFIAVEQICLLGTGCDAGNAETLTNSSHHVIVVQENGSRNEKWEWEYTEAGK